jgi:hydrogenase maturation protein HypF
MRFAACGLALPAWPQAAVDEQAAMRERRAITIRGVVQGVGFRPFVYGLASRLELSGFVKNRTGEVLIEVEGEGRLLDDFLSELAAHPPPLAQIEHLSWEKHPSKGEVSFRIEASEGDPTSPIFVGPDIATCNDCLAELFNPADRRYRYPFLNCTNCGPRLTIITGAPYDREKTTMSAFPMCPACRAEYEDPRNRRFHAQPTACADCGPWLELLDAHGMPVREGEPLAVFVAALRAGQIGAMKGLGGYHLVCDAGNAQVAEELRRRKHRDEKPFAIMVKDMAGVDALCEVLPGEEALLTSPRRPILLLRKRPSIPVAEAVAPQNPYLGVMLPYTPVHHLLLHEMGGIPLVMTSGNRSDEPIAYEDGDAVKRMAGIADLYLTHNRPIHVRCDDSVTRIVGGRELPLRRSRGYAPQPVSLPFACPAPILAVGGQFKGTFALGRDRHAFLSHHLGDLDHFEAFQAFCRDVFLYEELFAIQPEVIAHDLHPDYASTRYAQQRASGDHASRSGLPSRTASGKGPARQAGPTGMQAARLIAVQHHHAHMASCMAEHGLAGPVIGVSLDGTGYGSDGAIWGGEFLVGDYCGFRRAAHFRYVGMPGGDRAIREPWRMALAHLRDAQVPPDLLAGRVTAEALRTVEKMLERRLNTPSTSSAGRLFDAVVALAGLRDRVSYEGQAAMELEWLSTGIGVDGVYPFDFEEARESDSPEKPILIDTRPLIRAVAADVKKGVGGGIIGRRFHSTVVSIIASVCDHLRQATGIEDVAMSGGVFMNTLLTTEVTGRLEESGFRVHRHRLVPPNDGGLSLGQLAVAASLENALSAQKEEKK